jgi:methylmalonyl-CoA epimerase
MVCGKNNNPLKVSKLAQVGIVVKDLDRAMKYYEEVFGIGPWMLFEGESTYCLKRGRETEVKLKIVVAYAGSVQFELIQVLEGDTVHQEFLEERGEGLHHLGFQVHDLEKRLSICKERGIGILQRGTLKKMGLTIDYAYLDTVDAGGVIFEYIQTRFLGIPVKQWPFLVKLLARLQRRLGLVAPRSTP